MLVCKPGGTGCDTRPGGYANCCRQSIIDVPNNVCSTTTTAPCQIKPETAPTTPTGTPTTPATTPTTTPQQPSGSGATPEQEAAQPLVEVPGYQITLKALGANSAQYDSYFKAAAGRWQQIITGDLPGFAGPETPSLGWFRGFFGVRSTSYKLPTTACSFVSLCTCMLLTCTAAIYTGTLHTVLDVCFHLVMLVVVL
jgi:hypothetical protein